MELMCRKRGREGGREGGGEGRLTSTYLVLQALLLVDLPFLGFVAELQGL